jgi:REP-associated tyrosine transposase
MTYDPRLHHRRSIRLRGYDYAGGGAYFVTICAQAKKCLFGEIVDGDMILNEAGIIVQGVWDALPQRFGSLVLDAFQMMPNHLHAIFVLPGPGLEAALAAATGAPIIQPSVTDFVRRSHRNKGAVGIGLALPSSTGRRNITRGPQAVPLRASAGTVSRPLTSSRTSMGDVVGAFKSISTISLNKFMSQPGARPLHENFYEHIIRDVAELELIREYIVHNPQRWPEDPENPDMT